MKTTSLIVIILAAAAVVAGLLPLRESAQLRFGSEPDRQVHVEMDRSPLTSPDAAPETGLVLSYADMLERVTPSVVAVYTSRVVRFQPRMQRGQDPTEELFRRFFGFPMPEPQQPQPRGNEPEGGEERRENVGAGSGVIVSRDGFILTNNHVITIGRSDQVADEIRVQLADGREFIAELVGRDPQTDVAVLKIDAGDNLPAITMADSDLVRVGDLTFAIGNPLKVGLTVTKGIVSALGRSNLGILGRASYEDFIQTDASINMGNSGGALIDARGRLIGINTAILSRTGGNIGIGFAIPSNLAYHVMQSLIGTGEVARGFLGVRPSDLTAETAEAFGLKSTRGALITQVEEGFAADQSGIRHGDIVLEVNGREIASAADLRLRIAQMAPGSEAVLKIFRDGETLEKTVVLGDLQAGTARDPEQLSRQVIPGLVIRPLTDELRQNFSIPAQIQGLVIEEITRLDANTQRVRPGMVIIEVNGQRVNTLQELEQAAVNGMNRFYVWFDGFHRFIALRMER